MSASVRMIMVVILWIAAGAFAVSDVLCLFAMIHGIRRDQEMSIIFGIVFVMFMVLGVAAGYGALQIGRSL